MAWLYSNYSTLGGYIPHNQYGMSYNTCLTSLMNGAKAKLGPKDQLFTKLVLEAPSFMPDALNIIISYCHDEVFDLDCLKGGRWSGVWGAGLLFIKKTTTGKVHHRAPVCTIRVHQCVPVW